MSRIFGWMVAGGLLLGPTAAAKAQITIQPGRGGGSPSITFGQPAYPQYAPGYAQPNYAQPGYAQPGYVQPGYARQGYVQPGYAPTYRQRTYSSGYSGYTYPNGYRQPNYATPYTQGRGYSNYGASPYVQPGYGQGTGVIINGRTYMLPR